MALTIEEIKQKIQVIKDRLSKYNFQLGEPVTQAIVEGWEIITADVEKVGYLAVKKQGEESVKAISDHELVIKDRLDEHVSTVSIPTIVEQENKSKKVLLDWANEITTSDDGVVTAEREARIYADNVLNSKIEQEIADRASTDNTLNSKIEQEISDRKSVVTSLQNSLDGTKTTAEQALVEALKPELPDQSGNAGKVLTTDGANASWQTPQKVEVDGITITIDENGVISAIPPIGAVYIQFAGMSTPADLYGGTWSNISSEFAGLFFRAEGGSAAEFGSSQAGGLPNITGSFTASDYGFTYSGAFYKSAGGNGIPNKSGGGATVGFNAANGGSNLYGATTEVRPVNSTIRIWKRTA